jgi:hypothetical protein
LSEPPPGTGPRIVRPPGPTGETPPPPSRRKLVDRTVGIVLGIVLGIAVVAGFVFLGSEGTVDAPRISDGKAAKQAPPPGAPALPGQTRE